MIRDPSTIWRDAVGSHASFSNVICDNPYVNPLDKEAMIWLNSFSGFNKFNCDASLCDDFG